MILGKQFVSILTLKHIIDNLYKIGTSYKYNQIKVVQLHWQKRKYLWKTPTVRILIFFHTHTHTLYNHVVLNICAYIKYLNEYVYIYKIH